MHSCVVWLIAVLSVTGLMVLFVPAASAFEVTAVSMQPDILDAGDPVNVSCTVYAASGASFPSYDDLQFMTGLDDPVWTYTIQVNDAENARPADRGKILTIGGFELSYENDDEVIVLLGLKGHVPATAAPGANISVIRIQELNARGLVIASTVTDFGHRVGLPTPTPTPEYGRVVVASDPPGANVYLDNTIRGITPVTIKVVPNGPHTILLRLDGYEDYSADVKVTADAPQVNAVLVSRAAATGATTPPPAGTTTIPGGVPATTLPANTGSLSVTTIPPGALVYIDGQMKGVTPATIPGLSPGVHTIRLIQDGYQDLETTTEITAGTTSEFITGLPKRKQAPGFTVIPALAAVGLLLAAGWKGNKKT